MLASRASAANALKGPRLAVVDYSKLDNSTRRRQLGRYDIAILGLWPSLQPSYQQAVVQGIREASRHVQIAQYTILSEYRRSGDPEVVRVLDQNDWWLWNASGDHVQWTADYGNWEVNVTDWAPRDGRGTSWPCWKASYDRRRLLEPGGPFEWVFADTVMDQRVRADWRRAGSDQQWQDVAVSKAVRLGFAQHWRCLREQVPGVLIMANASPEFLASPELSGLANGAFLEGMLGKTYSPGRHPDGFQRMWRRYRSAFLHTSAPHCVVFQVYGDATDEQRMRYGLGLTLLHDGYFAFNGPSLQQAMPWFDEYDAPLGDPIQPPPEGPEVSGLWMRRYQGGLVLVNPGPDAITVELPAGYRNLSGSLSPSINNGAPASRCSLAPLDARILVTTGFTQ